MTGKIVWLGAALVVLVAAALYLLRAPAPEMEPGSTSPAAKHPGLAHPEPLRAPPSAAGEEAKSLMGNGHDRPGNGNGGDSAAAAKPARRDPRISAREREFIAKLFAPPGPDATEQERLTWEQSPVSDLLYPNNHPCAGQPLDSTSPALLEAAGKDGLGKLINDIPDVDTPQCVYEGNWPFHPLNQFCSSANRDSPEAVARCTEYLVSGPQDPKAYPATVWLPCPTGAQATTRRAYFENMLAEQVAQAFAGPRCTAN